MRYARYVLAGALVACGLFVLLAIGFGTSYATKITLVTAPLSLWTGRLITAHRTGVIRRRMPMLDSGGVRSGTFWSFRPDVYERQPGFDYFKGYFVGEAALLILLWLLFLSVPLMEGLERTGLVER